MPLCNVASLAGWVFTVLHKTLHCPFFFVFLFFSTVHEVSNTKSCYNETKSCVSEDLTKCVWKKEVRKASFLYLRVFSGGLRLFLTPPSENHRLRTGSLGAGLPLWFHSHAPQ